MSNDNWQTPKWLFDELHKEFNFSVDLCATPENKKCEAYFYDVLSETNRGIEKGICSAGTSAFMNPPYSNPYPFVQRAWELSQYTKIVCLLKVDTSTKWWAIFWDHEKHQPKPGCQVRFLPKRIKFVAPPELYYIKKYTGPTFPTCVVIMDRRNERD